MVITSRTEKSPYRYTNKAGKTIVEDRYKVIFIYEKADGTHEQINVPRQKTKSAAIDKLRELNKEHTRKGTTIEHRALTFHSYAEDYKNEKLSQLRTEKGESAKVDLMIEFFTEGKIYAKDIEGFDNLTLDRLRRPEIKKFKNFLQKTKHNRTRRVWNKETKKHETQDASKARSPRTINTYLERLRAILREAATDEKILSAPSFKSLIDKDKEVKRNLTIDFGQLESLLAACDVVRSNHDRKHLKVVILSLHELGCRTGELEKIQVKDIDLNERIVKVWTGKRKTPKQRLSYISERLAKWITENGILEMPENARAFGETKYYARSWRTAKKIAGFDKSDDLKDLRLNDLRHCLITNTIAAEVNLSKVQKNVGHSAKSAMTLDIYDNPRPAMIREAMQKYEIYSQQQIENITEAVN